MSLLHILLAFIGCLFIAIGIILMQSAHTVPAQDVIPANISKNISDLFISDDTGKAVGIRRFWDYEG